MARHDPMLAATDDGRSALEAENRLLRAEIRVAREAAEITAYWKPHSLLSKCQPYFDPADLNRMFQCSSMEPPTFATGYNSMVPPYETVLEDGLLARIRLAESHIKKAKREMAKWPWDGTKGLDWIEKIDTWEAMIIACKAVISWARRHARLCKVVAERFETDPKRKAELLEIADICQRVPAEPCKGLKDAFQAKWFTYLICHAIERYASGYAQKEDTLLWPYYKASVVDKSFQPMTHQDAVEWVEMERLKVSEHGAGKSRGYREIFPGSNDLFILTIGGTYAGGVDACNDMTDAILEGAKRIRTTEPSIVFRYSKNNREKTLRWVFECIRDGLGFPSIKNDEIGTQQMLEYGKYSLTGTGATEVEAHHWANVLCMSPGLAGRRKTQKTRSEGGGSIFPAKILEISLNNGYDWSYGGGFKVGAVWDATSWLSLGVSYQSRMWMTAFDKYQGLFAEEGSFDIAPYLSSGIAIKPAKDWAVLLEHQRIFYSDISAISNSGASTSALGSDGGAGFGWDDMDVFKLGVQWHAMPDLILRSGFSWATDFTDGSQVLFNTLAPATTTTHVTFGFAYHIDDRWSIQGAYTHAFSNELTGVSSLTGQTETIRMDQDEVAIGFGYRF